MKFNPPLFHPNSQHFLERVATVTADHLTTVYASGDVCISILHAPGDDPNSYESSSERWSPVQSVEKILLSVISMLAGTFYRASLRLHDLTLDVAQSPISSLVPTSTPAFV